MDSVKTISKFVRDLKDKCIGYENINGNKLYQLLRDKNIIYYNEDKINVPRQEFIDKGYFEIRQIQTKDKDGNLCDIMSTFLTEKGQKHLLNWLIHNKYIKPI